MPLESAALASIGRGFFEREIKMGDAGVRQSGSIRSIARLQGWLRPDDAARPETTAAARAEVKRAFLDQLTVTESYRVVKEGLRASGIDMGFFRNDRPLTNKIVKRVMSRAEHFCEQCVARNERESENFCLGMPALEDPGLRESFMREVRSHPDFSIRVLTHAQLVDVYRAIDANT